VIIRLPRRKGYIRPSKNRIQFERLLYKLGYRDRSPVYPEQSKKKRQINYHCDDGSAMAIYLFIIPYLTKKSYVYPLFLRIKDNPNAKEQIKCLCKMILFEEKTMLFDVGWEAKYTKQPSQYDMKDKTRIIFDLFRQLIEALSDGICGYNPKPGIVLAAKPYGPKINEGFNESSIIIGSRQRYLVAKRVGFGNLYENGFCYARYDDDCVLRPI